MIDSLSAAQARELASSASGIGAASPGGGPEETLAALRRLGSVQIDTISVVERAHHHVLWTRNPGYRPEHLEALEAKPRRIVEYWSHAAAYLPIEDYRFCLPRMERIREHGHEWFKVDKRTVERVRARVRAEGPLRAQDFSEPMRGKKGWWDWKPAKIALEYLFQSGQLVVVGRRGFQKVYDLPERALPPGLDLHRPSDREMAAHHVDRAALALGAFAERDVAYMRKEGVRLVARELASRVEDGSLLRLGLKSGANDARGGDSPTEEALYAAPAELERLSRSGQDEGGRAFILSPFDPLLIDRRRCMRLFERVYQIECYLPEKRRSFGYFALPILELCPGGDARLVGRLDAKADRGRSVLELRRLYLDAPDSLGQGRVDYAAVVAAALAEFAAFNGAARMELGRLDSPDGRLERSLRAALAKSAKDL